MHKSGDLPLRMPNRPYEDGAVADMFFLSDNAQNLFLLKGVFLFGKA